MEFLHENGDHTRPIDSLRVNWYYRPKDIQRKVTDTRVLFASMHSDTCPLSSIRGKCYIRHRSEIDDIDEYRRNRDSFYFERMFDRYIHRYYDVIPTISVRNVPEDVRTVLIERWKFLLVEPQRGKELCSQMKECKRCAGYCASNESVHCAVCNSTYHMNCVRPPLLKKPSRGFAWACGPCNRAQERKLEARNTPNLTSGGDMDEDIIDEEEDEATPGGAGVGTRTPSEAAIDAEKQEPTPEQLHFARMWQMRYLGQHCSVEDALDYDDRIYPRAASRIGPRHQAIVPLWPGRPVEYVKPIEKKKYSKGGSKSAKLAEAEAAARPPWVMEEPAGYIERGKDDSSTSQLLFKMPEDGVYSEKSLQKREDYEGIVDHYMDSLLKISKKLEMKPYATNLVDKAIELLYTNDFNEKKALEALGKVQAVRDLKEPRLRPDEIKRFEEGVTKYGSELHLVTKHVKSRKEADIVRFYYQWKKTAKGREIWGSYEGRKNKKQAQIKDKEPAKLVDDVADDEDDSAFDVEKAGEKKRGFECKFCFTKHSRQWRRAPGVQPGTLISGDKPNSKKKNAEEKWLVSALCRRCAELWRRYGIQWEDPDEIQKKVNQGGGRAWRRRIDDELLKELISAQADAQAEIAAYNSTPQPMPTPSGTATPDEKKEPPKKKIRTEPNGIVKKPKEKDREKEKEKEKEREAKEREIKEKEAKEKEKAKEPPPPPEPPKPRIVACGVCSEVEEVGKQHAVCRDCKMAVHRRCYGVQDTRHANKWVCEMCANDKKPEVSTNYECVLCPHQADPDAEPEKNNPYHKSSYKKKAQQEKAKDSPEIDGRKVKEADKHRPQQPREPLKKTVHNNWAHVICAVWTPEIKFSDTKTMRSVEGVGSIPHPRWLQECKVCKTSGGSNGACVQCPTCHAAVHVSCAKQAGWTLAFEIQPVKGSRRDTVNIVKLGNETGNMVAVVSCPEHETMKKPGMHHINEVCEETDQTAFELYISTYKQADLSLTGTARKANQVTITTKTSTPAHRRNSLVPPSKEGSDSPTTVYIRTEGLEDRIGGIEGLMPNHVGGEGPKKCIQCQTDCSPLWWKVPASSPTPAPPLVLTNGNSTPNGNTPPQDSVVTNGNSPCSRMAGLLCNRCRLKRQQYPGMSVMTNGHRPESKFDPLPPLHVFLTQQNERAPPPPPPPPPPQPQPQPQPLPAPPAIPIAGPGLPGGVPGVPVVVSVPPQVAQAVGPQLSHQIISPPMTQTMTQVPSPHTLVHAGPPPALVSHQPTPPHPSAPIHQQTPPHHAIIHHQAVAQQAPISQPPHHMSPRAPQLSHSPHIVHQRSPPTHAIAPPQHVSQQQLPHMSPHKQVHHISPPPPQQVQQVQQVVHQPLPAHTIAVHNHNPHSPQFRDPLMFTRQSGPVGMVMPPRLAPPQSVVPMQQQPPQMPPQAQPLPLVRPEEPKRSMSGASGSPALANLLS
ncbi:PHD finger and BAH domain protein [Geopyxis carbonaria]|nr:PHD finger and BAH domain protein [Geopyxis carbonaria]